MTEVNQTRAQAGRDIAGRDINRTTVHNYAVPSGVGIVEQLLQKLKAEMEHDQKVQETIERLHRFHTQRADDGIRGLQAKLEHSGRESEYLDAIEKKEMFVKLLEQWSLYLSAQKIFAFLLARAEQQFKSIILPQISALDIAGTNKLVSELIIEPTVLDCGASVFEIDHNSAMGMIYWLAEQCFIRWHK